MVHLVAVALHRHLGVKAALVHVAQAVAYVGHDVETAYARQLYELVQVLVIELEALLVALVLDVIEVLLVPEVVQGAEDEVVLGHGVNALGAGGVMVALAEFKAEGHINALRGLFKGLDILVGLLLRQDEAVGAYLHRLGHSEVGVVREADLGDAALLRDPRHLGHAVLRVKGAGAVYVVVG